MCRYIMVRCICRSRKNPRRKNRVVACIYSLELSAIAKDDLIRREAGFPSPPDPSLPDKFKELAFLEKSIGRAGKLVLTPLLPRSSRDLWDVHMLDRRNKRATFSTH